MENSKSCFRNYEFWNHTLHQTRYVVAPMVDMSELAFRLLCRKHGAQLCYTPMFNSMQYLQDPLYRREMFTTCPEDRPLFVQFSANNPDTFVAAAKLVEPYCDAVDLNLGCPQAIARKGQYGAFLQDKWDLLQRILRQASNEVDIPITCKIRSFPGCALRTVEYARMLQEAGASLLAVHGRTRDQKGDDTGLASWDVIKEVKQSVSIPVFANGNILCYEDVQRCLEYTGVDGVMSAEGILHNPALFTGTYPYVWDIVEEYLSLSEIHNTRPRDVRTHLFRILQYSLEEYPVLRKQLAISHTIMEFREICDKIKAKLIARSLLESKEINEAGLLFQQLRIEPNEKDCKQTECIESSYLEKINDIQTEITDLRSRVECQNENFQNSNIDYNLPIWLCHSRPRVIASQHGDGQYRKPIDLGQKDDDENIKLGSAFPTKVEDNVISKNVERKIRRHLRVLEARQSRRKIKKECRKERAAELKKSGIVPKISNHEKRESVRERMLAAKQYGPSICIDLSFSDQMTMKEQHRLASQLRRLYGSNQHSTKPVHIYFSSFCEDNPLYSICCEKNEGFLNYIVDMTSKKFTELWLSEDVIYLTPDSRNVLKDLEESKVYVIGGLVDENVNKNLTLRHAEEEGVSTARLPIEEYMSRGNRGTYSKVLAVNQVFDILLQYHISRDWNEALLAGVPLRKGFVLNSEEADMAVGTSKGT